jgi:hypothetical protein
MNLIPYGANRDIIHSESPDAPGEALRRYTTRSCKRLSLPLQNSTSLTAVHQKGCNLVSKSLLGHDSPSTPKFRPGYIIRLRAVDAKSFFYLFYPVGKFIFANDQ